jgi:hypothetical protein
VSYEINVVHPAVAQWLTDHGYTWQHEVNIPTGRIDFLATHKDGQRLIVECKSDADDHRSALRQLLDYQLNLGSDYLGALAIPSWSVTDQVIKACKVRGVTLIAVDVPEKEKFTEKQPSWIERLPFYTDLVCRPRFILRQIVQFHENLGTPPRNDIFKAYDMAQRVVTQFNRNPLYRSNPISNTLPNSIFESALDDLDTGSYQSLREFSEKSIEFLENVYAETAKIGHPYISKFGIIPHEALLGVQWEAEKQAEFYAMAEMIEHFDYIGDGVNELVFVDDNKRPIDDSLIWEGSANSFESAEAWDAWRKANRPSWFDQFSFLSWDES